MHRRKLEESEIERSTEIMPVQHIVMFTLQDDVAEDKVAALKKGLLDLPEKLGLFVEYKLGTDLKLEGGQNHPAGKNRSIVWCASFATIDDYEKYEGSQEHIEVVSNLIKPIIVPGSRAAIQYEL
jgi:Stress responsive A/B Barrel Domain